ncbi:MAG TPA: hypothetical protein VM802_02920 [Chitinophaga sp.]|uniref:hypothetical protein n=1 Tax=Chitinophaga sp. TaxID=1869181 RepID=UPI002B5BC30B|nr:hypothetical protein [Chitinophaga sp.]HVI43789.1 hypothetical protein [Chitinophaga sp.]
MKTRSDQLELSQYRLTEMNAEEMRTTNGGGLVDDIILGVGRVVLGGVGLLAIGIYGFVIGIGLLVAVITGKV